MTKFVLITGFMGCGKSSVSNILRDKGYMVINLDNFVKELYKNDIGTKDILLQTFGERVFNGYDREKGKILVDFDYLKTEIFKPENDEKRKKMMRRILKERIYSIFFFNNYIPENIPVVFLEAALTETVGDLIEQFRINDIINVCCNNPTPRLLKRGMTQDDIDARRRIQKWPNLNPGTNTYTVNNDLPIENLEDIINYILETTNLITTTEKRELFKNWIDNLSDSAIEKAYCSAFKIDNGCKYCPFPCKNKIKDKNDK